MNWKFQNLILGWALCAALTSPQLYAESCKGNCPTPLSNCGELLQKPQSFNLGSPRKLDRLLELQFQNLVNQDSKTMLDFKFATFAAAYDRLKADGAKFEVFVDKDGHLLLLFLAEGNSYFNRLAALVEASYHTKLGFMPSDAAAFYHPDLELSDGSSMRFLSLSAKDLLLNPRPHWTKISLHELRHAKFEHVDTLSPLRTKWFPRNEDPKILEFTKLYKDYFTSEELRTYHSDTKKIIRILQGQIQNSKQGDEEFQETFKDFIHALQILHEFISRNKKHIEDIVQFNRYEILEDHIRFHGKDVSAVVLHKNRSLAVVQLEILMEILDALEDQVRNCKRIYQSHIKGQNLYLEEWKALLSQLQTQLNPQIFKIGDQRIKDTKFINQ